MKRLWQWFENKFGTSLKDKGYPSREQLEDAGINPTHFYLRLRGWL